MTLFSKLMRTLGLVDESAERSDETRPDRSPVPPDGQPPLHHAPQLDEASLSTPSGASLPLALQRQSPASEQLDLVDLSNDEDRTAPDLDPSPGSDSGFWEPRSPFAPESRAADVIARDAMWTAASTPDPSARAPRPAEEIAWTERSSENSANDLGGGVTRSPDGRFHAGGYAFTSEAQARSYAARSTTNTSNLQSARSVEEARPRYQLSPPPFTPIASPSAPPPSALPPPAPPPARVANPAAVKSWNSNIEPRWVIGPERMVVGSVAFDARMVYVGNQNDRYAYPRHPSLIDPALLVFGTHSPSDSEFAWNVDYAAFEPAARKGYLEWLAAGRPGGASPSFANLYFYGLERRLLLDDAKTEAPAILAELRRLMPLYGDDYRFGPVARSMIDLASLIAKEDGQKTRPSLALRYGHELPLRLRIELGERVAAGDALDAEAALCWLLATPDCYPRTPVTRCFDEFVDLWGRRFSQSYPNGLKVRVPKARINYRYQSATGFHVEVSHPDVPDLSGTSAPIERLRELMNACSDELGTYSRLIGSNEAARGTLPAAALLPNVMSEGAFGEPMRAARTSLALQPGRTTVVTADAAMKFVGLPSVGRDETVSAACQKQLAQRLDAMAVGFEPDRRFGAAGAMTGSSIIGLFETSGHTAPTIPEAALAAARVVVDVAILAASSDGTIVPAELLTIEDHVAKLPEISDDGRRRLAARIAVLTERPPKVSAALKRLTDLPADVRRAVAAAAAATILSDGQILPAEVRFLENLYKVLGLPQDDVYAVLHRGGEQDGPVSVLPARSEGGVALPPHDPGDDLTIDATRLARIRSETSEVSRLLASIFVEDVDEEPVLSAEVAVGTYPGLDEAHSLLLSSLIDGAVATRQQFDIAVRAARLGSEGAIETINEWGFEQFDQPVFDDDESLSIDAHILIELKRMESS